jgi:hypothetical protein
MAVTLTGSPFDPTPANNTVRVNGLAATVLTASATSLMFRVPAGATSGPVEVTTPTASGTGATPLTVHSMPPDRLQVPTMDLLAYWTFDQDGRDDAGSLDLTLQGGVTTETDGMLGMALDFQNNPSQIGVRTADAAAFNFGATPFTVALWVRWTSTTGEQVLLDKCDNMCAGPGWTLTKIGPGISISNARNFAEFAGPSETAQITLLLITIEISHSLDRQNPSYALALSGAFGLGLAAYKTASPTAATIDVPLAGGGCPTKSQSKSAR